MISRNNNHLNPLNFISYQYFFIFLLYILYINFNKKPYDYVTYFIISLGIPITILGSILSDYYFKNYITVPDIILKNIYIYNLVNVTVHLLPALYLVSNYQVLIKNSKKTKYVINKSIVLLIVILLYNILKIDSYQIYKTIWKISKNKYIFFKSFIILGYILILLYINKIIDNR